MAIEYYQGYLETFNLSTGFTLDEYCFLEIGERYIIRLEELYLNRWELFRGDEVGRGHFPMRSLTPGVTTTGTLHRAPGYDELEGHIEFDDTPCLIRIELMKRLKRLWDLTPNEEQT